MNKTLKSIWAVIAGFFSVALLSTFTDFILELIGVFPPLSQPELLTPMMLSFALIYRLIYTVYGGYLVAKLAPSKPMKHAIILAAIGTVIATIGTVVMWNLGNQWYPIALTILSIPCVLYGAKLYSRKA